MNEISNQRESDDEIDLIVLLKKVYLEKKFILKTSILAALFGIVYALISAKRVYLIHYLYSAIKFRC